MLPSSLCKITWITSRSSHNIGSYMSSDGDSGPDVRSRIGKAASIFKLLRPIWSSTTINLNVKLRLYTAIVNPTAMYACETWKRTAMIVHRLDVFHRRCLRAILGISWSDHVTNEEVMRRAGMAMYWMPEDGRRKRGGQSRHVGVHSKKT